MASHGEGTRAGALCEKCGRRFEPRRTTQRFCSKRCQNAAAQRRAYWRNPSPWRPGRNPNSVGRRFTAGHNYVGGHGEMMARPMPPVVRRKLSRSVKRSWTLERRLAQQKRVAARMAAVLEDVKRAWALKALEARWSRRRAGASSDIAPGDPARFEALGTASVGAAASDPGGGA